MTIYGDLKEKPDQRHVLLQKLTRAVCLQIELWDTVAELDELVDVDLDSLAWVQSKSIVVDAGADLTMSDVDDYVGQFSSESNFGEGNERNWKQ